MATKGQRFELDLDANDFTFNPTSEDQDGQDFVNVIKEIKERDSDAVPSAPQIKPSKTGFPEHRKRIRPSTFKQKQQAQRQSVPTDTRAEPSDQAILNHIAQKHGVNLQSAKDKAEISAENTQRINNMSLDDIEQARSELMSQLNPELLHKFLKRANIEDDQEKGWDEVGATPATKSRRVDEHGPTDGLEETVKPYEIEEPEEVKKPDKTKDWRSIKPTDDIEEVEEQASEPTPTEAGFQTMGNDTAGNSTKNSREAARTQASQDPTSTETTSSAAGVHFPNPPRDPSKFVPLDPNNPDFLNQLKSHYFPDLPHDPNALSWLQDPTEEDIETSTYNPAAGGIAPSAIRFAFNGTLIPPNRSLEIPTSKGLHHHGDAPSSAGYTIPELALLSRSSLPNQRSVAYQILGRIFYRLGRGDFGPRGGELQEKLWEVIERERPLEVIMAEANRDGGHMSAKAYATEALWLWRKGGGGDRGILKEGERRAN